MQAYYVAFLLGLGLRASASLNVSTVVDRAIAQLEADLQTKFESGLSRSSASGRSHKKTTPFSQALDQLDSLVMRSIDILRDEHGHEHEEARELVSAELANRQSFFPNGDHGVNVLDQVNQACFSQTRVSCNPNQWFRNINGQCNNLNNPLWGAAGTAFKRLVPSRYKDGRSEPIGGGTSPGGNPRFYNIGSCLSNQPTQLPNARVVSTQFHPDFNVPSNVYTHMVTQMGQFLDHDVTLTPETALEHCCDTPQNSGCFPISIPQNDYFYSTVSRTCMDFSRSTSFCSNQNSQRQQVNDITSFIDCSQVYGSDNALANQLRFGNFRGRLFFSTTGGRHVMLPQINGEFTAGDIRATEMPGLATMHTLLLREHNRIADDLHRINPQLNDENLYQRARAMVIAEFQHVIYGEYLPVLFGQNVMSQFGLWSSNGYSRYNANFNPSISNAFATAAYRFGHSMIQGLINLVHESTRSVQESFQLKDNFNKLDKYFGNNGAGMQRILNGLITQPAQDMDRFVVDDVTNHLFPENGQNFGSDLIARNIQRGRDHGLPGYNDYRQWCGMPTVCSWNQRPAEISQNNWNQLRQLYQTPWDIDIFVAGLAETPFQGGVTGRIFQCIKAFQFQELKYGDRYFFTHSQQAGSFNFNQLRNIQQRTLADIICDNTEITVTKSNVFLLQSRDRPCFFRNNLNTQLFAF
eukprot:maker-scaffold160_size295910-snap-gene-1.35 protein:Tk01231 transcript:maker-scaffold160_size295910-snap-gene-1.35-mRNA-1 annotation:"peroxinectin "